MNYLYKLIAITYFLALSISAQDDSEVKDVSLSATAEEKEQSPEPDEIIDPVTNPDQENTIVVQPSIFDEREILSIDQVAKIKEVQKGFYDNHKCIVSYGFYDGHLVDIAVRQDWKNMVAKDVDREFHMFLNIGVFSKGSNIEIDYRYPPALKNPQEIDTILINLKRDLQSENGLDALLERSYESVNDELGYLRNKPLYESNIQDKTNAFEADQLKLYLIKILKVISLILIPIIALLIIWYFIAKLNNSRSYSFPEVEHLPRFGAKYSATSIAKIRK